jgi:hypothetical protein
MAIKRNQFISFDPTDDPKSNLNKHELAAQKAARTLSGRGRTKQLVMRYGSAPNMKSGGEAKHFLVNNSQENSVSLSNTGNIKEQSVKAQDGMEAQGNQLIQQLQQAVSQGATIEDLAPQVLQMTQGDPNMAIDLLVQAGFSKDQVSQQVDSIANQMEQQAMSQSQQGRPSPQGAPSPEAAQAQASPEAGMPAMNMGGTAKNREFQNPFVQMMQQGGKQDFDSIRKQMVKEYRNGGVTKDAMDTSSTEAYAGDMKNRLTANMFAGYAINKLGNDFKQMQEAAAQSMKYGGTALPKAENGVVVDEQGVAYFDPDKGEYNEGLKKYGINSLDELTALDADKYVEVMMSLNKDVFNESDLGKEALAQGFTYEDVATRNAEFNAALQPFRDAQVEAQKVNTDVVDTDVVDTDVVDTDVVDTDVVNTTDLVDTQGTENTNVDLQKKLDAYGVTEEEYLADPELKKEIDATTLSYGSESTIDRIKKTQGYTGTEEQQKAEAEQQRQVQAEENRTTTGDGLTNQQKSLSGDFDLTTAQFLTRPLTDIVQGAAGVRQAFGEKELTDQVQFKGKGSMAGMSREEMAKALETGAIKTGSIGDMYTRRDARRLARGKTNRGIFGGFEEINPYGKRVYFDQTPVDAANNVEPNPDENVDPNNPVEVEQANANAANKENPDVAAARDAVDRQPQTQVQASTQGYQQNDDQNEIDAQYDTALSNLKAQGIENPTRDQLNSAIDMVEQIRGMSGVAPGEMQPENWMDNYNQYVQKLGGLSPAQLFQMALGGLIVSENQLKYDRPFTPFMQQGGSIPKGYHRMPDGQIMADSAHYKAGGVGGYKNEGYIDFEPIYQSEIDFAQIADGGFQAASGVNELLESMNRYVSPEQRAANRNVNAIFNPRNRGSLIEGKIDMQTGQMAAQDAGDTIYAGQMGDRATRQRRGITNEFMAKYGLEVGQEITLSQNELRALKSAGYILTPKK